MHDLPTTQAHKFVRPGQVRADLPPRDFCVRCGASEASHTASYADDASAADERLDERLAEIRRQQDDGTLSLTDAAAERTEAMEAHLTAIRWLRQVHFGEGSKS